MTKPNKLFDMKSLLHNTFVLYFILFISVAYLFFFMQTGNFRSVFVFLLVGFLTSFYSKNMIVVLTCALIGTRIISSMDSLHEGLETKNGNADKKKNKDVKKSKKDDEESSEEDVALDEELDGVSNKEIKELLKSEETRKAIQSDLEGILKTQNEMIEGMSKLEPLIDKAEKFRKKYQKYEGIGQKFIGTGK